MPRRLASISHHNPQTSREHMSPPQGDGPSPPESHRPGGLANVLRGLTTSKLSKSSSIAGSPSGIGARPAAELANAVPMGPRGGLSPNHMESFELLKNGSPNERIAAANTLRYAITEYPLNPVLDIWYAAKDLIDPSKSPTTRTAGWELLTECVKHNSSTDLERKEYFNTLSAPANPEDFHLQLAALVDLTNRGRVLTGFDYEIIPLLTNWLQASYNTVRAVRRNATQAARGSKNPAKSKVAVSGEEKNLAQIFSFIKDVIKFSCNSADEAAVADLIQRLLSICVSTNAEDDLRSCVSVIDIIVIFGEIPDEKLKGCIQILSSIFSIVSNLQKEAWNVLSNLCKSHNGQAMVRILLDILRDYPQDLLKDRDVNREVRGAIAVLQKLISKSREKGYPAVPFSLIADGLSTVVKVASSNRILIAALQLINALFDDGGGNVNRLIIDEDWAVILNVAAECFKKTTPAEESAGRELLTLITRLDTMMKQKTGDYIPRQTVIKFFMDVHSLIPDTTASAVLDFFQEFRCCSPSDLFWEDNLGLVLNGFFANRQRSSHVRLRALETIMDAYEVVDLVGDEAEQSFIPRLAKSVLQNVAQEVDVVVLDGIVALMISVVASCDMELFNYIIDALRGIIVNDRLKAPISTSVSPNPLSSTPSSDTIPQSTRSPSNVVTKGYVKMFAQTMDFHGRKSVKLFSTLVNIAKSNHFEVDARLTAMKLLFRVRADWANRIFVTKVLETNFLAASIWRTEASLARKQAEEALQSMRHSRSEHGGMSRSTRGVSFGQAQVHEKSLPVRSVSVAGSKAQGPQYQQLWSLPDPEAVPENISGLFSPMLVSHLPETEDVSDEEEIEDSSDLKTTSLNISTWIEAVLTMLQGCDWEVYSFVIVHLPSQLSNHALFRDAIPQIQELRRAICELLRTNCFQEPPNASGLRRSDVAVCLFHSLTMILSYHHHFQKGEEDEIVRTFVHGIATWERSAKCCIHALSICCHELPLSASKSLVQLLTKMSTIITQPHVSIHILEFLACLSRLHNVYVNFREEEYKIVFGICFRYLQSVRDKKEFGRNSHTSESSTPAVPLPTPTDVANPSASDDLPQYVYALAYHVILFWFLALKLPDRAKLVAWIVKNLFSDMEESQDANEQALITVDFMQRVTYADVDESFEDALFMEDRFGEILKKRWLVGNSIVTVRQATTTGWAEIIKRQPSGTSAYVVRETFNPPPPHQIQNYVDISREGQTSTNTILPSHLLVQLISSAPQTSEDSRPIPLPEDENVERAIRVFDRSSTVDGHKVGVIYIGEGQTQEAEILANVSGSNDYGEFLNNLGTLTRLKGATFNTHGLDREYDMDGQYTFCWRDRVTEIVFHVTTQMPTNFERDPQCTLKKRHIGNDFVNIIFNDSGLPYNFDTFPGDFNFVHIVITPASRASFIATREATEDPEEAHTQSFYRVQVLSKPGFPEISPASETKIISLNALPGLIRLIALNASVFSHVWANREGGEHVSSWRSRLREIKRLRDRYAPKISQVPASNSQPSSLGASQPQQSESSRPSSTVRDSFTSLRRTSVATFFTSTSEQTSHRSSMLSTSTNDTEIGTTHGPESIVDSVDFSKWA